MATDETAKVTTTTTTNQDNKGDTTVTTMTTTAPCPCPVIPKSALETAAIIASTEITPMAQQQQQQQQQRSSIAPTPAPTLVLVAPPPTNLPVSAATALPLPLPQSLPLSLSQSHPKQQQQQQPMQQRPSISHPQIQQSTTQKISPPITVTAITAITATPTIPTKKPINTTNSINNKKKNDTFVLRSGKWTPEEETYANILIEFFEAGEVDEFEHHLNIHNHNNINNKVGEQQQQQYTHTHQQQQAHTHTHTHTHLKTTITNGMTLRSYLSRKLFCSPMRISKKFAGKGIGKRVYMSQNPSNLFHHQHFPHFSPNITGLTYTSNNNTTTTITSAAVAGGSDGISSVLPYPQHHPFGGGGPSLLPSSSISSSSPSSTANHWNKINRLKAAETNFLKVAFPHGDPMEAYKRREKIHPALLKAASTPYMAQTAAAVVAVGGAVTTASSPTTISTPRQQQQQQNMNNIHSNKLNLLVNTTTTNSNVPQLNQYQFHIQSSSGFGQQQQQQQQQQHNQTTKDAPPSSTTLLLTSSSTDMPGVASLSPFLNNSQQRLKEAYFSSVSGNKSTNASNGVPTNAANVTVWPNNQMHQQHSFIDTKRSTHHIESAVPQTCSSIFTGIPSSNNSSSDHSSKEISTNHSFNMNQMKSTSATKLPTNIPNFLSGFDNVLVSKNKHYPDQNATANNDATAAAAADLHVSAQYSPAYHTSKSFDDFHRYLGEGLSPAAAPPPKFPILPQSGAHDNSNNPRPAILSIDSSEEASMSNLQLRPRGQQHNTAIGGISKNTTKTISCLPFVEERSDGMLLSEAYAEAVARDSVSQPSTAPAPSTHNKDDAIKADSYSIFVQESAMTITQHHSTYAEEEKEHELQYQDHDKHHYGTEFPLEGMTFEDFGTLGSSTNDIMLKSYANNISERAAVVSEPSDCPSEDPNSGSGGGTSDESDGTQSEGSSRGIKKARFSGQSRTWGKTF